MSKKNYTTNIDDLLVVMIIGDTRVFIGQVKSFNPLRVKVTESGPYSNLRRDDLIIDEKCSARLQKDVRENTQSFLQGRAEIEAKVYSSLETLGVTDGELHEILPGK